MSLWINRNKCGNYLRYVQLCATASSIWHLGQGPDSSDTEVTSNFMTINHT